MSRRNDRAATYRLSLSSLLLAMMLILGYVESQIPLNVGVPGIKLGLSNGVLIFAVYMLDVPIAFTLMALKVVLSGLLFSGVSAMMYGMAGGLLSLVCMVLLSLIKKLPVPVVSIAGGIMHNVGQIALSLLILGMPLKAMLGYLLVLCGVGAACGLLTGVCARSVLHHMKASHMVKTSNRTSPAAVLTAVIAVIAACVIAWQLSVHIAKPVQTNDPEATPAVVFGGEEHQIKLPDLQK